MTAASIALIPPRKRDSLFRDIRKLVQEIDAQDRSLGAVDEDGALIDQALEEIAGLLASEIALAKRASRRRKSVAA